MGVLRLSWTLGRRTVREFLDDDCMPMAAGIAYYAFFSLFPLLLGLIAILGLLLEPAEVQAQAMEMVAQAFPASAELVTRNLQGVVASRGAIGALSLVGLLWSAMAVFAAIRRSVNRAWDVEKERPFWQQKLVELGMVGGVGMLVVLSLAGTVFLRFAWQFAGAGLEFVAGGQIGSLAGTLLPAAITFAVFVLIYRFVPNASVRWGYVWPGALLATVLFEAGKNGFTWYLANFANYSLVYGSVAAILVFLLWAYASALILLLGAELASEYSRLSGSHSST